MSSAGLDCGRRSSPVVYTRSIYASTPVACLGMYFSACSTSSAIARRRSSFLLFDLTSASKPWIFDDVTSQ